MYFIKVLIYSNFFVSLCVTAFTHLTYLIYDLPRNNLKWMLLLVFCFTFFIYNGQRIIRLRKKNSYTGELGERLTWVNRNMVVLSIATSITGLTGAVCLFFIHPSSWYILIPMGILSVFYVTPINISDTISLSLREIPFLKIFLIAAVWSFIIVGLPLIETQHVFENKDYFWLAVGQNFYFVLAITLPFDIRDLKFDQHYKLNTLPQLIGVKGAIIFSEFLLVASLLLLYFLINNSYLYTALVIGYLSVMITVLFTNENRNELFFAGLIEGTVLMVYSTVILASYFSFL